MKSATRLLVAALALAVSTTHVSAQEVRFKGTTNGCFGFGCTDVGESFILGEDILRFTGSSFDAFSTGGALDFGGSTLNFGYFSWENFLGPRIVATPFTLFINFLLPEGISPDPTFGGGVAGLVQVRGVFVPRAHYSTVDLFFMPESRSFTFAGGQPDQPGSFRLTLDDVHLDSRGNSYLTGRIDQVGLDEVAVAPEPVSMALLGTGLAGVAVARRRKRRENAA